MASTATSTLSRRRRRRTEDTNEPLQLLRPPPEACKGVMALLSRPSLTRRDLDAFLKGQELIPENEAFIDPDEQAYNDRRREIRELTAQVESGEAEIDEDMRLVPTPRPAPPGQDLPQHGPAEAARPPPVNPVDREEEERRWLEREDREAADAIARAVRRYRQAGVPEEDFVLVRIAPRQQHGANLTFRRICFAVMAVVTAFICIMLQSLQLIRPVKQTNLEFDSILLELLQVREFKEHAKYCGGLDRHESNASRMQRVLAAIRRNDTFLDCADGVLHIPPKYLIFEEMKDPSTTQEDLDALEPFATGVNVSWFFPCAVPEETEGISDCFPGTNGSTCSANSYECFRGVHDGLVRSMEVETTLRLASELVKKGGDHIEIRRDVSLLSTRIPSILETLKDLLHSHYHLHGIWAPVAFRISVALPMDGTGVRLYGNMADSWLERTFNRSVSIDWMESTRRKNELAAYSLPPPFATKSVRDVCYLMSDLEADPDFAVHTSVFLSDSAGVQYAGGAALYVDDHPSNAVPRNKIQRGISIDGSRGRVVVSTGGAENRRCRMATRAGIRAVLQIWWNCTK